MHRIVTKPQIAKLDKAGKNSIMVAFKRVKCSINNDGSQSCDTYKVGLCIECQKSLNNHGLVQQFSPE